MKVASARKCAPEGHINREKIKRTISRYGPHEFYYMEDVIRNFLRYTIVLDRGKIWMKIVEVEFKASHENSYY